MFGACMAKANDPAANVAARRSAGGPSPAEVHANVAKALGRLAHDKSMLQEWRERMVVARENLDAAIHVVAAQ